MPRKLGVMLGRLGPQSQALDTAIQAMEERFLLLGSQLEALSTASETLVARSEALVMLAAGRLDGQDEFRAALEVLQAPMGMIDDCQSRYSALFEQLKAYQSLMEETGQLAPLMTGLLTPLSSIQIMFRVESATLAPEVQTIFTGLTKDIESLHEKAVQKIGEQFQRLGQARQTIENLLERMEARVLDHQRQAVLKKRLIQESVRNLETSMAESQRQDVRLVATLGAIRNEVGRMITGMQFQDITKQKLANVQQALGGMQADYQALRQGGWRQRAARPAGFGRIHRNCSVQAGQLEAVHQDLAGAQEQMSQALQNLRQKASGMNTDCIILRNLPSMTAAENGMVQVMLDSINDLRELLGATVAMQGEIAAAVQPLQGMVSDLTEVMGLLAFEIKIIALNAQIQAAHLGAGHGLEVLAARTCAISEEVDALNRRSGNDMAHLSAGLNQLSQECQQLLAQAEVQKAMLADQGAQVEDDLHCFRDRVLNTLVEVNELSDGFIRELEQALAGIQSPPFADPSIAQVTETLAAIRGLTQHWKQSGAAEEALGMDQRLRDGYTMESQRQVHLAALDQAAPSAAAETQPAIDWFEADPAGSSATPPSAGSAPTAPAQAGAAAPDVQPQGDAKGDPAAPAPAKPPPPEAKAANLGDNVEFF